MPGSPMATESAQPTRIHNVMFQRPEHFLPHLFFLLLTTLYIYIKGKKNFQKTKTENPIFARNFISRSGGTGRIKETPKEVWLQNVLKEKKESFSCRKHPLVHF